MKIIETIEDFENVVNELNRFDCILIPHFVDARSHVIVNELSCLWLQPLGDNEGFLFVFNHNEGLSLPPECLTRVQPRKAYCFNKKQQMHLSNWMNIFDVQSLEYLQTGKPVDLGKQIPVAVSHMMNQYWNYQNVGKAVPLMVLADYFSRVTAELYRIIIQYGAIENHPSYTFLNDLAIPTLYSIEKVGLGVNPEVLEGFYKGTQKYVHNGIIYSDYNLFTSAGRPSNKFGGLNFAAMAKKSGIRDAFVSRFKDGRLVMIDFESFHLRLIAELMNFELPAEPVHEFLGKQYFSSDQLTPEQYDEGKEITFQLMYSDSPSIDVNEIPFFKRLYEYTEYLWNLINLQGFITSPLFNRKIYLNHIENPTPAKVFNYLVQLSETEYNIRVISELSPVFESMIGKPMLYTYDALLIDIAPSDIPHIKDIVNVLEQGGKFPVRVYQGLDYGHLEKVNR